MFAQYRIFLGNMEIYGKLRGATDKEISQCMCIEY